MMFPFRDPRGKKNLFSWEAAFEIPVKETVEHLMSQGAVKNVSVDVLVAACADLAAIVAAKLDLEGDQCTIEERMEVFCERVVKKYREVKQNVGRGLTPWGQPLPKGKELVPVR